MFQQREFAEVGSISFALVSDMASTHFDSSGSHAEVRPAPTKASGSPLSAVLGCSTLLMVTPSQTVARVDTFLIAVLPQAGQHHLSVNEVAVARCFGMLHWWALVVGPPIVSLVVGGDMLRFGVSFGTLLD